jgi:hypothetical protein
MSADDDERDRLANECAALADECAELRDIVTMLREVLAIKERELARATRLNMALDLERDELTRRLAREPVACTTSGRRRHFLHGRAVHAGDLLEVHVIGGGWIAGRYEWSFRDDDLPRLCGVIAGVEILLPADVQLRWPAPPARQGIG